ncbi:MAG: hypothetical protein P0116_12690 [Candidatus Nitrosocosmicus sp.]|nr:hypothetical protein [Candidatus Nitrosocosmicus sp.]
MCDKGNSLAYLESSNPRNIPYKRHGFDLLGTIQVEEFPPFFQCYASSVIVGVYPNQYCNPSIV